MSLCVFRFTDEVGADEVQFSAAMSVEQLCQLLKIKGVDEEDCALFRSERYWCLVKGRRPSPSLSLSLSLSLPLSRK